MTIETEDYQTRDLMKQGKRRRNQNGWRSLHTDFVNNVESDGYHVTFVNGSDDPDNSPEADQRKPDFQRQKELSQKLKDRTITQTELLELLEKKL